MALPDPDIVQPADAAKVTPQEGESGGGIDHASKSVAAMGRRGSLDAFMQRFEPHQNDHGSSLFNHPATNRGGSPDLRRAPEPGRPSTPAGSGSPGRHIDIPMFRGGDNAGNGAPRRANGTSRLL